ncbi:MAG: hypothetical protein U1E73_08130 [Planctomycetota bacterium]
MITAVACAFALAVPQVRVEPMRAAVGEAMTVHVERRGEPVAGAAVRVEQPDGSATACAATDARGNAVFAPAVAGRYVFRTAVDGVEMVTVGHAEARLPPWVLASACVPLGLALLWSDLRRRELSRARGRRGSPPSADPAHP